MLYYPTLFSGMYAFLCLLNLANIVIRTFSARRNAQGQLEPDAAEDVVQNSLGFGEYEHAPKSEDRKKVASSSPS